MLLLRGATDGAATPVNRIKFQYMLLLRGATWLEIGMLTSYQSFNTCSSCEEQLICLKLIGIKLMFQYMLLLRGATRSVRSSAGRGAFQYMLLLRGATFTTARSLLAGSFNTCSSCEEQLILILRRKGSSTFQYMLLLRGATIDTSQEFHIEIGFNTCSSCEEQQTGFPAVPPDEVSIHAPLARSNSEAHTFCKIYAVSIHAPLARSNWERAVYCEAKAVSIHAPLARSNPESVKAIRKDTTFQYMLLLRGATQQKHRNLQGNRFNTCSSCEEQHAFAAQRPDHRRFNTCSSCEEQLTLLDSLFSNLFVSIHAPLARSNWKPAVA